MKNRFLKYFAVTALSVGAMMLITGQAKANSIIPTLVGGAPTGSGPYTYTYSIALTSDDVVKSGNVFVFYDVVGYVAGSASTGTLAAGWAVASQLTTAPPAGLSPSDSGSVPNLVFTYSGGSTLGPGVSLGNVSFQSIYGGTKTYTAAFVGSEYVFPGGTVPDSNITSYVGPVPEPASVIFLGTTVLGLAGLLRRRLSK